MAKSLSSMSVSELSRTLESLDRGIPAAEEKRAKYAYEFHQSGSRDANQNLIFYQRLVANLQKRRVKVQRMLARRGNPSRQNPKRVIIRNAKSVSLTKLPGGGVKVRVVRKKKR